MAERQEEIVDFDLGRPGVDPAIPDSLEELVQKNLWGPLREGCVDLLKSAEEDARESDPTVGQEDKIRGNAQVNPSSADDKEVKGMSEETPGALK